MFIFYKMEYVIAYKTLLKESIDDTKKITPLFWNVTCLKWEHAVLLIFMSVCFGLDDTTASLCLKCFL